MALEGYRGLDEELFRKAYFESEGDAIRASKLGNFEYSHRTYVVMWRKLKLISQGDRREKRISRQAYAFGDLPEAIGRAKR
jgi:hypothetical protein